MGKKDKKKKGTGAEKTALKTERKALNKLKKTLAAKGEENIEKLITEYQEQSKNQSFGEELCSQPSPRSGFTLCAHPDKEELLLFGGEFYNGSTTLMYNDLYFYNIKKNQWSVMKCPDKPPPRCSHQAVVVSQRGGQMWIFGGEFASPTRSMFHHYKDFWVFHLSEKRWELIKAQDAPTPRSGHRMVASRKQLIVFGGFHESVSDYRYFNDVHIFDLETYTWSKIEPVGKGPSPRSGCQMAPLMDGRILLYGGYTREKVKKDVDKGIEYTDMYYLQLDERTKPAKWKWIQSKPSGVQPTARSGFTFAVGPNNQAYAFGGVQDEDEDENLSSLFYNDLYLLDLEKGRWILVTLHAKDSKDSKRRRRGKEAGEENEIDVDEETEVVETLEKTRLSQKQMAVPEMKTFEDGIFSVKIGPQTSSSSHDSACSSTEKPNACKMFQPKPRMNASIVIKHGILYLYGGLYEEGDQQLTLSDFYSLDIHKLDGWHTIVPFSTEKLEWIESEESSSEESDSDDDVNIDEDTDNEGMDTS